jgi:hypothetical protein
VTDSFSRPDHARNKAFFEAHFSSYIEGTTFEIEEAESIIFDRKVPAKRPGDAVSDVHPFVDGNGRVARVMMNAELVAAGRSTIIIPTVFRDDYLLSLRAMTRRHRPAPLITALTAAQRFSTREFAPYPAALRELEHRNWFREPDEARIIT